MNVRSFMGLFAQSPFQSMQDMGDKVIECADELGPLFEAFFEGDYDRVRSQAEKISALEHEADKLKNHVRDQLPKSIFLPVDRRDLLKVIASLDTVADNAEDVGILFTLREMERYEEMVEPLKLLLSQVLATVQKLDEIIAYLNLLVDVGFKGKETRRLIELIEELSQLEHEADVTQDTLARTLFTTLGDDIPPTSLLLWNKILNKIGDVANAAEKFGARARLFVAS